MNVSVDVVAEAQLMVVVLCLRSV